ncbi:MAG: hypothetical protein ACO2OZ_03550 [Acidilobaceae archaeon]
MRLLRKSTKNVSRKRQPNSSVTVIKGDGLISFGKYLLFKYMFANTVSG